MSAPSLLADGLRQLAAEASLRLTVRGACMQPALREGQEVRVVGAPHYRPGDVVAFDSDKGRLVVHRVIGYRWRSRQLLLQTRADATGTLDPPVDPNRVIGRVIEPELAPRRLRSLWRFARLWTGGRLPR